MQLNNEALLDSEWVISGQIGMGLSDGGQHTGQNLRIRDIREYKGNVFCTREAAT